MSQTSDKDLKNFVDKVAETSHLRVAKDLGDGYVKLRPSEAQRRQAQQDIRCVEDATIELLRNSRDAGAKNIYLATNTEENFRHLLIIDDGCGVPETHHETIFEPYVTSKLDSMSMDSWGVHGRGMALYSIKENAEDAHVVNSNNKLGCAIAVKCDTKKLGEKRDQSSFPEFYVNENSELVVRGPKNILRTACEFAVESRDSVNVYIGSPVEIAATLYNQKSDNLNVKAVFNEPDNKTKLVNLLSYSSDVHDFKNYARELGIFLSKRTARRIMDGDIKPQSSLLERIANKGIDGKNLDITDVTSVYRSKPKTKSLKLDASDKEALATSVAEAFASISEKYYLDDNIEPKVTVKGSKISISFDTLEDS